VLVVTVGSGAAVAIDAVTFLVAAACLTRLQLATSAPVAREAALFTDIRAGWRTFRSIRWVWIVTISSCLMNLVQTGSWQILGPELTKQTSSEATWGFVLSIRGLGLLVMSALMYRVVVRHLLRVGQLGGALGALPLLALGVRLGVPWLIVSAFVAGLGTSLSAISWETSLQEHVPGPVLSRVASYDDLLSYIAIPIGQLAVGPLADAYGGFRVATIAALTYTVVALLPLASRSVRQLPHGLPG
jgi:hypothetical protein